MAAAVILPAVLRLDTGAYAWCGCGQQRDPPLCTAAICCTQAVPFTVPKRRTPEVQWLCRCLRTRTPPMCDGSHNMLSPP